MKEQCYNKRNTTKLYINGEELTVKDISEKYEIPINTIKSRIRSGIVDETRLLYKGDLRGLK